MDISIIIPTHKPSIDFLGFCIRSLDAQTFQKENFEVIVVQNGPYENKDILDQLLHQFPTLNIKILRTAERGVSNARNMGIEKAVGRYICFIDDDDWVSNDYLEKLHNNISENIITASFVVGRESPDDNDHTDYIGLVYKRYVGVDNLKILEGRRFLGSACCKMIPRKIISNIRFDTRFAMGEDALFMASISKNIDILKPAIGYPTYYRRLNIKSASRQSRPLKQRIANLLKLWKAYATTYISSPMSYSPLFFANRIMATTKWLFK